ncbi:hypothetical protein DFJ73DRAFT_816188 [Zopfochytrium polystomum]|nr:hypothetical protein DFJ73DRAFT_816188 [Zopfochytrium polystomum]
MLHFQMSTLYLTILASGQFGSDRLWNARLRLAFLRMGFLLFCVGAKNMSRKCMALVNSSTNCLLSSHEMECRALHCIEQTAYNFLSTERLGFDDVLLTLESLHHFRSIGAEYFVISQQLWLGLHIMLQMFGIFSPQTFQDGVLDMKAIAARATLFCEDSHFIFCLKSCVAVELLLRNDYLDADNVFKECKHDLLKDGLTDLKLSMGGTALYGAANWLAASAMMVESGENNEEWIELLSRCCFGVIECLKGVPMHLIYFASLSCVGATCLLSSLALSLIEPNSFTAVQRSQIAQLLTSVLMAIRLLTRRSNFFYSKLGFKVAELALVIVSGNVLKFEKGMEKFILKFGSGMTTHTQLRLRALILRCRGLRMGKEEVAVEARALIETFSVFDNRRDPARLELLCC